MTYWLLVSEHQRALEAAADTRAALAGEGRREDIRAVRHRDVENVRWRRARQAELVARGVPLDVVAERIGLTKISRWVPAEG